MKIEKPHRVRRTFLQKLHAPPERVFPLLCPVREADWVEGWDPALVATGSGVAEQDCVFTTDDGLTTAVWMITCYDPVARYLEFVKITPGVTAGKIEIQLRPQQDGTEAEITYSHTALSDAGRAFVDDFTEDFYRDFMKKWEAALDHYLLTGEKLQG